MTSITQSGNTYCISLLSLACGALFYWINGYQTFNSDLYNYLPFVFSYQNSDLYPFDYFFTQGSSSASLWVPLVGELSEYFRIENLFFYSHVITTTLTFFCIGLISRLFLHQKMAVALVMVSFIPVIPILGSGLVTIDTYFNMRSVAIPLGLLGLYFFLQERLGLAVLFSGVAFLFHPLVSLPLFALIGLYLLHQVFRGHWKASLVSLTGLAAFTVPLLISLISSDSESYSPLSQAPSFWLEIVKERSPYVFLSLWDLRWLVIFFLSFFLFQISIRISSSYLKTTISNQLHYILVGLSTYLVVGIITTELFPKIGGISVQPFRSLYLVVFLLPPLVLALIIRTLSGSKIIWLSASVCFALISIKNHSLYPQVVGLLGLTFVILAMHGKQLKSLVKLNQIPEFIVLSSTLYFCLSAIDDYNGLFALSGNLANDSPILLAGLLCFSILLFAIYTISRTNFIHRAKINNGSSRGYTYSLVIPTLLFISILSYLAGSPSNNFLNSTKHDQKSHILKVAKWISKNTLVSDVILFSPSHENFRTLSHRSSIVSGKDGGSALYSIEFAKEWQRRMTLFDNYYEMTLEDLCEHGHEFHVTHVIVRKSQIKNNTQRSIFSSGNYRVVKSTDCI